MANELELAQAETGGHDAPAEAHGAPAGEHGAADHAPPADGHAPAPVGDAEAAGHGETVADGGHGATGMPQLDIGVFPNLIFWLILSIVALYYILSRVAIPRIRTVLAERNDAISNDLEQAALLKRRAEEAETSYNAALAAAREEAQKIGAETKAQINKELATLLAKADAEIAARSVESETRIGEIRDSAARDVETVAKETARNIVEAMLPSAADEARVSAAVETRLKG